MDLTADHMDVLRRLRDGRCLPPADRKQDQIRQSLRKAGLIKCVMNPRRWVLTVSGASVLGRAEVVEARESHDHFVRSVLSWGIPAL